jgi:hypothetical protein
MGVRGVRSSCRSLGLVGVVVAGALLMAACGSSGTGSSSGTTHPKHTTTSSTPAPSTTAPTTSSTSTTGGTGSGPMVTATLPVVVCQTTSGVSTTTTSLPPSVSVSVPPSQAQQGNLAVYSDLTGRLLLVGPTVGWTCTGAFGADGSGMLALSPVGTTVPAAGTTWHLPASSSTQAIVAMESGGSTVQGAALACPLFSAATVATQQDLGQGCAVTSPPQERVVRTSAVQVGFQDPAGVPGVGYPSGGLNAANGVLLFQPKATEATAYLATCTLPAAQQDLCTAIVNHFVATFG